MLAPHLRPLTSVRFFFALAVVLFHSRHILHAAGLIAPEGIGYNLVHTGYLGVQFFFVLSGFILAYTYGSWEGPGFRKSFWAARIARIYPIYLLGTLLILPFVGNLVIQGRTTVGEFAADGLLQATLSQAWFSSWALHWNSPGWSLSAEAFFYLLFPFLLPILRDMPTRGLLAVAVAAFVISQAIALGAGCVAPDLAGIEATNPPTTSLALFFSSTPLFRLPEFAIGMVAGLVFTRHGAQIKLHGESLTLVALALVLLTTAVLSPHIPVLHLNNGGLSPVAAVLFVGLAASSGSLARVLSHPWLVRLGEASYAVYILHHPISLWMNRFIAQQVPAIGEYPLANLTIYIVLVVMVSLAAYSMVEEPLRRRIKDRFATKHPSGPAQTPVAEATINPSW